MKFENNLLTWVAVVMSLISLAISMDNSKKIGGLSAGQTSEEIGVGTKGDSVLESVRIGMQSLVDDIEERELADIGEIGNRVNAIRSNLRFRFEGVEGSVLESWQRVDDELGLLENNLRNGGVVAIDGVREYLLVIERRIESDGD